MLAMAKSERVAVAEEKGLEMDVVRYHLRAERPDGKTLEGILEWLKP